MVVMAVAGGKGGGRGLVVVDISSRSDVTAHKYHYHHHHIISQHTFHGSPSTISSIYHHYLLLRGVLPNDLIDEHINPPPPQAMELMWYPNHIYHHPNYNYYSSCQYYHPWDGCYASYEKAGGGRVRPKLSLTFPVGYNRPPVEEGDPHGVIREGCVGPHN